MKVSVFITASYMMLQSRSSPKHIHLWKSASGHVVKNWGCIPFMKCQHVALSLHHRLHTVWSCLYDLQDKSNFAKRVVGLEKWSGRHCHWHSCLEWYNFLTLWCKYCRSVCTLCNKWCRNKTVLFEESKEHFRFPQVAEKVCNHQQVQSGATGADDQREES